MFQGILISAIHMQLNPVFNFPMKVNVNVFFFFRRRKSDWTGAKTVDWKQIDWTGVALAVLEDEEQRGMYCTLPCPLSHRLPRQPT